MKLKKMTKATNREHNVADLTFKERIGFAEKVITETLQKYELGFVQKLAGYPQEIKPTLEYVDLLELKAKQNVKEAAK